MKSAVEQIKERLPIVDCISSYIQLEPSGINFKAKCPFHNEKTPSFFVSVERNSYYCFGCSAKGDVFSFVEQFEGLDFKGALKVLADRTGVKLDEYKNTGEEDDKTKLYKILEDATLFFEKEFEKNNEARAYLISRGLTDKTIKDFRVGFALNSWYSVKEHLVKIGYKESDIEKAGLIKTGEKGSYDRFRSRIMFPITDTSGRVIAFSGRLFGKDDKEEAKYLNSPDTILFNKSNVLFGIDKAKSAIRVRGYSIVVEGQMDLLMSHQAGFTNTVAVSGTAFSGDVSGDANAISNFGLVRRLSQNLILAFDGDKAGIKAAGRSALLALSLDMQVKVAVLKEGLDPADIIKESIDEWKEIIKNSKHAVLFFTELACKGTTDIRAIGRAVRDNVFKYLIVVKSEMEQSGYIKQIHDITGVSEEAIRKDFEDYKKNNKEVYTEEVKKVETQVSRKDLLEKRFFGIIFSLEKKAITNELTIVNDFITEEDFNNIRKKYEPYSEELAFEVEMFYGGDTAKMERDKVELAMNLEQEILEEKRQNIKGGDMDIFQKISSRIEQIKNSRLK